MCPYSQTAPPRARSEVRVLQGPERRHEKCLTSLGNRTIDHVTPFQYRSTPARPRTVMEIALDHVNFLYGVESAAAVPSETVEVATSTSVSGLSRGFLECRCMSPSSHTLHRYIQHDFALLPTIWKNSLSVCSRAPRRSTLPTRHTLPYSSVPWPLCTRPSDARFAPSCAAGTGDIQLDELCNQQRAAAHGVACTIFLSRSALEAPRDDMEARQVHRCDARCFRAYRALRRVRAPGARRAFLRGGLGYFEVP